MDGIFITWPLAKKTNHEIVGLIPSTSTLENFLNWLGLEQGPPKPWEENWTAT